MKICTIAPAFNRFGGIPYVARNIVSELSKKGVENFVITDEEISEDVKPVLDPEIVKIYSIHRRRSLFPLNVMEFAIKGYSILSDLQKKHNFDLIHVHGNYVVLPVLAKMLKKIDIPLVETVHGTYLNEIDHYFKYPKFKGKVKYCIGVYIDHLIQRLFSKKMDKIITVSSKSAEELVSMFGFKRDEITIIPNGINPEEIRIEKICPTREKFDIPSSANVILSVGDIIPRKGMHILIQALSCVKKKYLKTHIVFAGGYSIHKGYLNYLQKLARSLEIEEFIHFTGVISRKEKLSWLRECDVFASPSFSEGCAINILEAGIHGKPIAATDVGGAKDTLGELGYYAKPNDHQDFARAIFDALDRKEDRGREIRERIESNFTWDRITDRIYVVYCEVKNK